MMKSTLLMILVSVVMATSASPVSSREAEIDQGWANFISVYGKNYHPEEEPFRKVIFSEHMNDIINHNSDGNQTFTKTVNMFTDMSDEELDGFLGDESETVEDRNKYMVDLSTNYDGYLKKYMDHRRDYCMVWVKDQGACGSCWAFSGITPLEFAHCKKYSEFVVLSEQQLVDCAKKENGCRGCNGGWNFNAWHDMKQLGGVVADFSYPYVAKQGVCGFKSEHVKARIADYKMLQPNVENIMIALNEDSLVSVSYYVAKDFYGYSDGIYDTSMCDGATRTSHAVVIVGYGTSGEIDYWIVRNSWSEKWGMGGYFKMRKGVNLCLIESAPRIIYV